MSLHSASTLSLPQEVIAFFSRVKRATADLKKWDKTATHVRGKSRKPKKFTPDGRMIGDIGEVIAERAFAIKLRDVQGAGYDAVLESDPRIKVEIKMTRKGVFQFRKIPKFVIALAMKEDAKEVEVVYNGLGSTLLEKLAAFGDKVDPEQGDPDVTSLTRAVNVKPHEIRHLSPLEKEKVPRRSSRS